MISLRPYQKECSDQLLNATGNFLVNIPTGTGKTEIFLDFVKRTTKRVLILVENLKLLDQCFVRANKAGLEPVILHNTRGLKIIDSNIIDHKVYISTVQSLLRYKNCKLLAENIDVIIFDEAHHLMGSKIKTSQDIKNYVTHNEVNIINHLHNVKTCYKKDCGSCLNQFFSIEPNKYLNFIKKLIEFNSSILVFGFTATAVKDDYIDQTYNVSKNYNVVMKANNCLCRTGIFNHDENNSYVKSYQEMKNKRYLTDVKFYKFKINVDIYIKEIGKDGKETIVFQNTNDIISSYEKFFQEEGNIIDLFNKSFKKWSGKKTVIFLPSINSTILAKKVLINHFNVDENDICLTTSKFNENLYNINNCNYILNCMQLTEGFDLPSIENIVIMRPCTSPNTFLQIVGRCVRLDKNNPDKIANIYDYSKIVDIYKVKNQKLEKLELVYNHLMNERLYNKCNLNNYTVLKEEIKTGGVNPLIEVLQDGIDVDVVKINDLITSMESKFNIKPTKYLEDKLTMFTKLYLENPFVPVSENKSVMNIIVIPENSDNFKVVYRDIPALIYNHKKGNYELSKCNNDDFKIPEIINVESYKDEITKLYGEKSIKKTNLINEPTEKQIALLSNITKAYDNYNKLYQYSTSISYWSRRQ